MTDTMPATIAAETTRVESFEWVVIPSIVLLVSHSFIVGRTERFR